MLQALSPSYGSTRTASMAGDRSRHGRRLLGALGVLLVATMIASLMVGVAPVSVSRVLLDLVGHGTADPALLRDRVVVLDIRLPRMLLGVLVGAALAVSGAVLQGLFRNPLADPGLIGISSGAGFGAVFYIVLGGTLLAPFGALLGIYALPMAALIGGLLATLLLYRISTRGHETVIATLLLAGIAFAALAGAATGLLVYIADDGQLRDLTFWGLGSLAGADWTKLTAAAPVIGLALATTPFLATGLNAMTLGEATAHHLGVPVQRLKLAAILAVAAATGAAVASSGGIGFGGIVVPHLLRLTMGPDHRFLLPGSALLGAVFLLIADAMARTLVAPAELPIGIVTAAVGGPFFLWILLRRRGGMGW